MTAKRVIVETKEGKIKKLNFYEFLGVSETASNEELKSAYRKMCFKFHPDRNMGDKSCENNFKSLQEVWEIMGNQLKKINYDKMLLEERYPVDQTMGISMTFNFSNMSWTQTI